MDISIKFAKYCSFPVTVVLSKVLTACKTNLIIPLACKINVQYCAKVTRANFGEIQRTSTNFSENGRYFEQNEASSICERIFKAAIVVICSNFRFNTRTVAWYFERFFVEDNESSRGVFRIIAKSFEFSLVLAEVPAKIHSPLETLWIVLSIPLRCCPCSHRRDGGATKH